MSLLAARLDAVPGWRAMLVERRHYTRATSFMPTTGEYDLYLVDVATWGVVFSDRNLTLTATYRPLARCGTDLRELKTWACVGLASPDDTATAAVERLNMARPRLVKRVIGGRPHGILCGYHVVYQSDLEPIEDVLLQLQNRDVP